MSTAALLASQSRAPAVARNRRKDVLLMERVGPTSSELFVANLDGSGERRLLETSDFDFHASFSPDGQQILFTSGRRGRGQADLYVARADGTRIRALTSSPAVEDAGVFAPDGITLACVSTREAQRANLWTYQTATGRWRNLTGRGAPQGDPRKPDGFYRPAWSPDGQWLAFSSDRGTEWRGHPCVGIKGPSCSGDADGWEHIQQLGIYLIRPDGRDFRSLVSRPGYTTGSPKWSPDGRRVIFYEMAIEQTWTARIPFLAAHAVSQIVSVDVGTGERIEHTEGPGLKLFPQFLPSRQIAYQIRAGADEGLYYSSGAPFKARVRSPNWSPEGTRVIYERTAYQPLPQNTALYSWEANLDYRYTDSFPRISSRGELVLTEQALNSSIAVMQPDGGGRRRIFDTQGKAQAFAPCWSPDGEWVVFGLGRWFENRAAMPAALMRVRRDGTGLETLIEGAQNAGFPSYSPDGRHLVFRLWGSEGPGGLRILDLTDRSVKVLTSDYDNLPDWSPDGRRIVFTRRLPDGNFDIFTLRPDGSALRRLTTSGANDAHAIWSPDGRILWTSGAYGFKDEAALYDNNFQPYGQIWIMNADGSGKRVLTDSLWEDGEPMIIPARFLSAG